MLTGPDPRLDRLGALRAPPVEPAPVPLEARELAVLHELGREPDAQVAFQGLRRRLALHQEALSRTLRRLERDGLVAKEEAGYRLTEQGFAALRGRGAPEVRRETLTVVQAVLPPQVGPEAVAGHLTRRWFRGLRWYGRSEGPGEVTLTWLADPGNAKVKVRLSGGGVALEVEVLPGEPARSFAAARAVLAALAELYGLETEGSPAGAFLAQSGVAG